MKFKKGDTVYLKAKVDKVNVFRSTDYNLEIMGTETFIITDEAPIYTKEEMLAELSKPEMPKVGYVYSEPPYHKTNVKVVFVNEKDVVLEDDSKLLRVVSIKTIQENFKLVDGPYQKDDKS